MRVDGDNERAKFFDLAGPERFRHAEVFPVGREDFLDAGGSDDSAACRENAVQGLVVAAAAHRALAHAAFADDQAHARLLDEFFFIELLSFLWPKSIARLLENVARDAFKP